MIIPLTVLSLLSCIMADPQAVSVAGKGGMPRVLVYTRTLGYRHDSIPTAIDMLKTQSGTYGVNFEFTEDPTMFVDDSLKAFDGVMFISTSEEVLDETQQGALARYFQSGGVYTGVHSASACLFNDTNYLQAVGAYFDYHPDLQQATFMPLNKTHPATSFLPDRWTFEEEVYYYRQDPRSNGATVLVTVDETSYTNNAGSAHNYPPVADPHPIAWFIENPQSAQPLAAGAPKAGRSFYTSLGHLNSTWQDDNFIQHVMNGLTWALDGASTKAYGVGLVGNQSVAVESTTSSAAENSGSSGGSSGGGASNTGSSTGAKSSSGSSTGAAATTSSKASSASRAVPATLAVALAGLAFIL